PLADLVTSNVVAPAQGVHGAQVEVRYTVTNRGSAATDATTWQNTIWLTKDKTRPHPAKGDIKLATFQHDGRLQLNESYERIATVTLPDNLASGTYYITAWSDTFDAAFEDTLAININPDDPNEIDSNNYRARAIQVIGRDKPDLVVTNVSAPDAAAGGPIAVSWTVENRGESETGSWNDVVYLSTTADLNATGNQRWFLGQVRRSGGLAQGQSYTVQQTYDLAPPVQGAYVVVVTDQSGADTGRPGENGFVAESDETNNSRSDAAAVTRVVSDLQVTSVTSSGSTFSGETATVTWIVTNTGAAVSAGTRYWTDAVWISKDPTFNPNRAVLLGAKAHSSATPLASGGSYTDSLEINLPLGFDGQYFLYVITDSDNNSFFPHRGPEEEQF